MRLDRLPLTYQECRARFGRAAEIAGLAVDPHPIATRGPDDGQLSIDVVSIGAERPRRALLVLSGVHGVEGFVNSALQCELIGRLTGTSDPDHVASPHEPASADRPTLPADMAVVLVHAVNPWGMAWWRRQNESNVDLNRNWGRDDGPPPHNDAYDEVHSLACPDTDTMPSVDGLLVQAMAMVAERGMTWVRDAITKGQYRHPDGLHFGGDRTEESNRILERVISDRLGGVADLLVIDLHTGHGPHGRVTHLAGVAPGSAAARFLCSTFGEDVIETTVDNPDATTGEKSGQIAAGIVELLGAPRSHCTTIEFGTAGDEEQLVATYLEQWVHRHGDRSRRGDAAAVWDYRCCFTPDDPQWEADAMALGAEQLDAGVAAVAAWDR